MDSPKEQLWAVEDESVDTTQLCLSCYQYLVYIHFSLLKKKFSANGYIPTVQMVISLQCMAYDVTATPTTTSSAAHHRGGASTSKTCYTLIPLQIDSDLAEAHLLLPTLMLQPDLF